jgi:hypothetical protein
VGREFYLAGGAGLALRLGHRRSADLDFFHRTDFPTTPLRRTIEALPGCRVEDEREGTLHALIGGVPVSFLAYPYPLVDPLEPLAAGLPVASLRDIGAMKLSAIVARGTRRDFVDLYALCRAGVTLRNLFDAFQQKAGKAAYNPHLMGKALVYFVDAEKHPMPDLLVPVQWDDVKRFFTREVATLFR